MQVAAEKVVHIMHKSLWISLLAIPLACGGTGADNDSSSLDAAPSSAGDPGDPGVASSDSDPGVEAWATEDGDLSLGEDASTVVPTASLPCGITPGNRWLAQASNGKNSDPLNMIICFKGVYWRDVFKALSQLPGRTFNRAFPLKPVSGPWREIYAPVDPLFPLKGNNQCINPIKAQFGSTAWREQTFSARENGCGSVLWNGVNHFRLWGSGSFAALAVSTEKPCRLKEHCIVDFNYGRELLADQLWKAASNMGVTMSSALYDTRQSGAIAQPDGSRPAYDGKVRVIALVR